MMSEGRTATGDDEDRWKRLTEKQRACLDLLLERKTSKQIARALDISKYTVDQRLRSARGVLDTSTRDETAIAYARLKSICDRVVYHPMDIPIGHLSMASEFPDGGQAGLPMNDSIQAAARPKGISPPSEGLWRPNHSSKGRVLITAAMLAAAAILIATGVVISIGLSQLVSR